MIINANGKLRRKTHIEDDQRWLVAYNLEEEQEEEKKTTTINRNKYT